MKPLPIVLWLVIHAAKSVGWEVEHDLQTGRLIVTEDTPCLTRKPRRWFITAEEQLHETR